MSGERLKATRRQPGRGILEELRRDRQEEGRERKTKPREDDSGVVTLRLPREVKAALVEHIEGLKAQGVYASMNSLAKALIVEYLRDVGAGRREPPVITRTEIGA